jgi:hypothetical protein
MLAVNRVFARGIIKQLGRPELLSATYNGNAAAAATAAMKEVGESVASALTELERASFIGENTSKADWSHMRFVPVRLQPRPTASLASGRLLLRSGS